MPPIENDLLHFSFSFMYSCPLGIRIYAIGRKTNMKILIIPVFIPIANKNVSADINSLLIPIYFPAAVFFTLYRKIQIMESEVETANVSSLLPILADTKL